MFQNTAFPPISPSTSSDILSSSPHHTVAASSSLPNLRRDHLPRSDSKYMTSYSPVSPPASPAPGHTASDLQHHLYASFLEQKTADVALRIRGNWHAIYKLHRVVLIQAGFFQSLFTAGFVESKSKLVTYRRGPDVIDIVFDDPNITRAAFELCMSRLYGGGPPLHISPSLIPTPTYPLTPSDPFLPSTVEPTPFAVPCPPAHHPASPRFLLSLLATSVFLSIPSIASQALSSILNSVGPRTVVRYLNFAIGKGIGEPEEEEPEAAVGLEGVAELLDDQQSVLTARSKDFSTPHAQDGKDYELIEKLEGLRVDPSDKVHTPDVLDIKTEGPSDCRSEYSIMSSTPSRLPQPCFFYGGVSDKIGEAVACWLTRWGADILSYEEEASQKVIPAEGLPTPTSSTPPATRKRASTIPIHNNVTFSHSVISGGSMDRGKSRDGDVDNLIRSVPVIWRQAGLGARWVRSLLSSDALFVRGEMERYNMARAVVELRRKVSILPEEEEEWKVLFQTGIHYANMTLDELMIIMKDISPTTGEPFVPLAVLQSAHWDQSVFQHHITSRPSMHSLSPPQSPSSRGKELGISFSAADILNALSSTPHAVLGPTEIGEDKRYFPVPSDSSSRVGDTTGLDGASMDQLFDLSSSKKSSPAVFSLPSSASEANCFGLEQQSYLVSTCLREDQKAKGRWSPYPPLRFGVEFWDVDALKEKSRLHSQTVWYAGSLWNVYVQVVRKKGIQLGVYLHRQSSVDPIPPTSAPLPSAGSFGIPLRQCVSLTVGSPTSRSSTPHSNASTSTPNSPSRPSSLPTSYSAASIHASTTVSNTIPATAPPVMPSQPYRDPRPAVSAYFTIACASATGASLTRFTSAPDVFSVSQSWGWKSSSLRTEEYLEVSESGMPKTGFSPGREISLRATIVLGVV